MPKIIARTLLVCPLLLLSACNQPQVNDSQASAATQPATETRQTPAGGHPLGAAPADDEYGEFLTLQKSVERAIRLNALFPHVLARVAAETGTRAIHISTDGVFRGDAAEYFHPGAGEVLLELEQALKKTMHRYSFRW